MTHRNSDFSPLKHIAHLVNDDAIPDAPYVGLENVESWSGRHVMVCADDLTGRAFHQGDVMFGKLRPYLAKVFCGSSAGNCSPEFLVLRPRPSILSAFLKYLLLNRDFIEAVNSSTFGAQMPRASWDFIGNVRLPIPSLAMQRAIIDDLDEKTADLDALIEKKRKLLDLLAEERAALINQAVTKALDPGVPMKNSGIPWIGEIPAHWAVSPLYARYTVQLGKMLDSLMQTGQRAAPYLRNADIQWGSINVENLPTMDFSPNDRRKFSLVKGDILICEGGANASIVGKSAIWNDDLEECYYQKALHRLRPRNEEQEPRFLFYALWAAFSSGVFAVDSSANIFHLTAEKLRVMRFPFPNHREQDDIVIFLDDKLSGFTKAKNRIDAQLARLHEYRQALITAAVTGQLDIGAAA